MKLAIGLLMSHGFPVQTAFVKGLLDWHQCILTGEGNAILPEDRQITEARIIHSEDFPIDSARNGIVRAMLDDDTADALLFLDADMRHPRQIAHRLVSHRLPIVTARYHMRRAPFQAVAMRRVAPGRFGYQSIEETVGLVPIAAGGAGALLIDRSVLLAMREAHGDTWFEYTTDESGLKAISEDMAFYQKAEALGIPAFCDLDCVCTHVASFEIGPEWHAPFAALKRKAEAAA